MGKSPKKTVIIIENDDVAFNDIKSVISADYPNDKQKYSEIDTFENFRKILEDALSVTHTDPEEPEKSKKLLFEKLKSYHEGNENPIYIIDFLLDSETYHNSINGIHFHKLIHQELYKDKYVPSLFLTNAEHSNLAKVQRYCDG